MATESSLTRFLTRLVGTTAAVVLIMYLAKIWFVEPRPRTLVSPVETEHPLTPPVSKEFAPSIPWQDALQYLGRYATVEGTIVASHNSGKACFLNFHPDYKNHFTAVIFASVFPRFPDHPEHFYLKKKVRVTGFIKEYQGRPEMILEDPSRIQILE